MDEVTKIAMFGAWYFLAVDEKTPLELWNELHDDVRAQWLTRARNYIELVG